MATSSSVVKYYIFMAVLSLVTPKFESIVVLSAALTSADNNSDSSCSPEINQVPSVLILPLTFDFNGKFPRPWVNKSEEFLAVYPEPRKPDEQEEVTDTNLPKSQSSAPPTDAEKFDLDKNPIFNQQTGIGSAKGSEQFNFAQTTTATLQVTTTASKSAKQYPVRQLYSHSPQAVSLPPKPSTGKTGNSVLASIPKVEAKQEILPKGHSSSLDHPTKRLSDIINQVRLLRPVLSFRNIDYHSPDTKQSVSENWQFTTQAFEYVPISVPETRHYRSLTQNFDHGPTPTPEIWQSTTQTSDYGPTSTSETWQSISHNIGHEPTASSEHSQSMTQTLDPVATPTSTSKQSTSPKLDGVPIFKLKSGESESEALDYVLIDVLDTVESMSQPLEHGPTSTSETQTLIHEPLTLLDSTTISKHLNSGALHKNLGSYPSLATRTQEPSISLLSSLVLNSVTKVKSQSVEDEDTVIHDLTFLGMLDTPFDIDNSTYIDIVDDETLFNSSGELVEPNSSSLNPIDSDDDIDLLPERTQFLENQMLRPYQELAEQPSVMDLAMESTSTTEEPDLPDFSIKIAKKDKSDGSFDDGEYLSGYRLVNIGKSEPMDLTSLEKELQIILAAQLPIAVDADLLNLWNAPYLQRLRHVNHEMVDEILQTDIKTPPKRSECPLEYHELTRASLQRMLGLLLLSLPQSLKEVEEAIWDQELDTYFFRHQEKNLFDVSSCRECYTRDPFGKCREIFFCKNGVAAGAGPRLTPQQMEMLLRKAKIMQ